MTSHKSRHSSLITHPIPAIIQEIKRPQMPIHPHIRPGLLILKYKRTHFISLDGIHVEALAWVPVISHLKIDIARKDTVDAADAVVVVKFDTLQMDSGQSSTSSVQVVTERDTIQDQDVTLLLLSLIHAAALPSGSRT